MREPIEQAGACVDQEIGRHLGGRLVHRVFCQDPCVDSSEHQRAQLSEDRHLGLEELGLASRQETHELFDASCRPANRPCESGMLLFHSTRDGTGRRVTCPDDRPANGNPFDDGQGRLRQRIALGVHSRGPSAARQSTRVRRVWAAASTR
jgi:hypothetical protein